MNIPEEKINEVVENIFKKYDTDKNGRLDRKEMNKFLDEIYKAVNRPKTNFKEINDLMDKYDKNKDGGIDRK